MSDMKLVKIGIDSPCECACPYSQHVGKGGSCIGCGACPAWRVPAAEQEALVERELSEMVDFGGRAAAITTAESANILELLCAFEDDMNKSTGWDQPPTVYVVKGAVNATGFMHGVAVDPLDFGEAVWLAAGGDCGRVIEELALGVRLHRGIRDEVLHGALGPMDRFVGVALKGEAWAHKEDTDPGQSANRNPALRADELRFVHAVDVDDRLYTVLRSRSTGEQESSVVTSNHVQRKVDSATGSQAEWLRETRAGGPVTGPLHRNGWPRIPRALRMLVRELLFAGATDREGLADL